MALWVIFQSHCKMRGVPYNHVSLRNLLYHPAKGHLSLNPAYAPFYFRIPFRLLIFILNFLLGHFQILLILPSLIQKIKKCHNYKYHTDLEN